LIVKANNIRQDIIKMISIAGSGHPGGSLSAVEILTALYFNIMKHNHENPKWEARDRFILSKGHGAPLLYAVLAESGYFKKEDLWTLRKLGSILQGHPDMKKVPGIEISTGSLGQGLSVAAGMALAGKMDKKDYRVYVMIGDGESQEGMIWEAAMFANHYKLDNLCGILDFNDLQIDGCISDVMEIRPVVKKWKAFGWEALEINGHDFDEIFEAFRFAESVKNKPTMIVAKTIKGKGVSFMENNVDFHGKAPDEAETKQALRELKKSLEELK
jgi:transketolase